jgi:DNA-binding NtrC family response regulator
MLRDPSPSHSHIWCPDAQEEGPERYVSQHRDVLDMVWLINHGQIFRFLRKPLSAGRTAISLQAALQHHRQLLKNPELVKRHEVDASATTSESGVMEGVLSTLKGLKRLWTSQ